MRRVDGRRPLAIAACDACWPTVRVQHHARVVGRYALVVLALGTLFFFAALMTPEALVHPLDVLLDRALRRCVGG